MLILLLIVVALIAFIFGVLYVATDGWQHIPEELPIPLPLEPYQFTRLIIFMNPDMDPLKFWLSHDSIDGGYWLWRFMG